MIVQQQAIRDHSQAMAGFFARTHHRPSWRKAGRDEGFRIVHVRPGDVRRLNRSTAQVWIPKAGWVRFRWSRQAPQDVKSYRVTLDRTGRWHVTFAAIPPPVPAPGNGRVVGIDRGVAVSAALSTEDRLHVPGLTWREQARLRRLERKLARAKRGSARRRRIRLAIARIKDMTRSAKGTRENPGRQVRQKAGLNRGILRSAWGLLVRRLEEKAPGRVVKVTAAFTSQRCSACGLVDAKSRKSQARFVCTACGYACHADVNAAKNIAAGHAVTARGGFRSAGPVNREPQPMLLSAT